MGLTTLLFAMLVTGAEQCRCGCVSGQPLTLCATIEAAQQQLDLCPQRFRCPPANEAGDAVPLASPGPQVEGCRRAGVWSAAEGRYRLRNLCDLRQSER